MPSTPRASPARSRPTARTPSSSARSASPRPPRATSTRPSTAPRGRSCRSSSSSRTTPTGSRFPKSDQTANLYASDNFSGFKNLKIIHCDGLDVFDSFRAMREAVAFVRSGRRRRDGPRHAACGSTPTPTPTATSSTARPRSSPRPRGRPIPLPRFRKLLIETGLARRGGASARSRQQNEQRVRGGGGPREGGARSGPRHDPRVRARPSRGSPRRGRRDFPTAPATR